MRRRGRPAAASAILLAVASAACGRHGPGGDAAGTGAAAAGAARGLTSDALRTAGAGRELVARVDGEPVGGDCVAREMAAARGLDAPGALDRCVAFELLAREAVRRGYLADPELVEVRKREMVRRLVAQVFAPTLDDPSDIPDQDVTRLWTSRLEHRYNKPERRRATYCRVPVRKSTPRGGEKDQHAQARAEQLARALSGLRYTPELFAVQCYAVAGRAKVRTTAEQTEPFADTGRYDGGFYARDFAHAAFSVAQVGQFSKPVRTDWGWDLVLLTEVRPPEHRSLEQAAPEIRELLLHDPEAAEYRASRFMAWAHQVGHATVWISPTQSPGEPAEAAR